MADREAPHLGDPGDVRSFPTWHVLRGATLHRVVQSSRRPWWFANDGRGRFDLPPPRGTCYLADDPLVALLEALGPLVAGRHLDGAILDGLDVWAVPMPRQCDAADTTARSARAFGVTGELATVAPYRRTQAWARAFAAAGFDGIRSRSRFDPAGGRCLALFGAAGERRSWRTGRVEPATSLLGRIEREVGLEVVRRVRPVDQPDVDAAD